MESEAGPSEAGPSIKTEEAKKPSDVVVKKGVENLSLPFSHVKRIVASHLANEAAKVSINKEATMAFSGGVQSRSTAWYRSTDSPLTHTHDRRSVMGGRSLSILCCRRFPF